MLLLFLNKWFNGFILKYSEGLQSNVGSFIQTNKQTKKDVIKLGITSKIKKNNKYNKTSSCNSC